MVQDIRLKRVTMYLGKLYTSGRGGGVCTMWDEPTCICLTEAGVREFDSKGLQHIKNMIVSGFMSLCKVPKIPLSAAKDTSSYKDKTRKQLVCSHAGVSG